MNDERLWIGGRRTVLVLGWEWGRQFTARSGGPHFPTRFLKKAEISEESWLGRLKLPIQRKRFFLRFHVITKKEEGGLLNISNIAQGLAYRLLLLVKRKARQGKKEDLGVSGTNATEVAVFAFRVVVAIESS